MIVNKALNNTMTFYKKQNVIIYFRNSEKYLLLVKN